MAKNKITDLRDHLFETLEALKDLEHPMDLERARVISEVAQTIINTAKVEVDLIKAVSGSGPSSQFFNSPEEHPRRLEDRKEITRSAQVRTARTASTLVPTEEPDLAHGLQVDREKPRAT
jgi:hypothetical protein